MSYKKGPCITKYLVLVAIFGLDLRLQLNYILYCIRLPNHPFILYMIFLDTEDGIYFICGFECDLLIILYCKQPDNFHLNIVLINDNTLFYLNYDLTIYCQ